MGRNRRFRVIKTSDADTAGPLYPLLENTTAHAKQNSEGGKTQEEDGARRLLEIGKRVAEGERKKNLDCLGLFAESLHEASASKIVSLLVSVRARCRMRPCFVDM